MNILLRILLLPISFLYGTLMAVRNKFYDWNVFESKKYVLPVISVGNLSVGGTGKSPHIEFLISKLKGTYSLASISRGYGRKTKGYILADENSTVEEIGDEPYQFKRKYPEVKVVVDEKRNRAIQNLISKSDKPDVILLDDAFQHRSVKPGLNILLTDYSHLYIDDYVLPSGRLREFRYGANRADVIIVTKSPTVLSPIEIRRIKEKLKPQDHQKIFFSYINYLDPKPLNAMAEELSSNHLEIGKFGVLLVTAIANPIPINFYLKRYVKELHELKFRDHHFFVDGDYEKIRKKLDGFLGSKMVIITEKDSTRFDVGKIKDFPVFYLPIETAFHDNGETILMSQIEEYVKSKA